ncbi:MAG: SCP2 sterol-binding domain-containing protein [Actinomycetota bacterium]|nr:SCP2 sterol-binding domain-containing protein [Actinomycetota bacterium]
MERFLSPAWFERVTGDADQADKHPDVVLAQVVTGTPEGEVRYQVIIDDDRATILVGSPAEADMTFTSDYNTASAIASGALSAETALSEGRIRVSGNLNCLDNHAQALAGLDPMASARADTLFDLPGDDG